MLGLSHDAWRFPTMFGVCLLIDGRWLRVFLWDRCHVPAFVSCFRNMVMNLVKVVDTCMHVDTCLGILNIIIENKRETRADDVTCVHILAL